MRGWRSGVAATSDDVELVPSLYTRTRLRQGNDALPMQVGSTSDKSRSSLLAVAIATAPIRRPRDLPCPALPLGSFKSETWETREKTNQLPPPSSKTPAMVQIPQREQRD